MLMMTMQLRNSRWAYTDTRGQRLFLCYVHSDRWVKWSLSRRILKSHIRFYMPTWEIRFYVCLAHLVLASRICAVASRYLFLGFVALHTLLYQYEISHWFNDEEVMPRSICSFWRIDCYVHGSWYNYHITTFRRNFIIQNSQSLSIFENNFWTLETITSSSGLLINFFGYSSFFFYLYGFGWVESQIVYIAWDTRVGSW